MPHHPDALKIDPTAIPRLREIADKLTVNELIALVAMYGLRNCQEANIDMVTCGDLKPDEIDQTHDGMADQAGQMMEDILNAGDLRDSILSNPFGDYSVEFATKVVVVTKKV